MCKKWLEGRALVVVLSIGQLFPHHCAMAMPSAMRDQMLGSFNVSAMQLRVNRAVEELDDIAEWLVFLPADKCSEELRLAVSHTEYEIRELRSKVDRALADVADAPHRATYQSLHRELGCDFLQCGLNLVRDDAVRTDGLPRACLSIAGLNASYVRERVPQNASGSDSAGDAAMPSDATGSHAVGGESQSHGHGT